MSTSAFRLSLTQIVHTKFTTPSISSRTRSLIPLPLSSKHTLTMADTDSKDELRATYTSPSGKKVFSTPLGSTTDANRSTTEKTAYLSDLRAKVSQLQENVNAFLTAKMEEDNAAQQAAGKTKTMDEDKEENMYGEEDPENDV
ncbi:hypothetical protein ANO11243_042930 [Dothideomycetidae sp. 11243]|nr:hypothetical protein ANO11243_042930 [fungal sp. No.11243]